MTKNDSFLQFYLVAQLKTSKEFIYFVGHTLVADTSNEITLWCFFQILKIYSRNLKKKHKLRFILWRYDDFLIFIYKSSVHNFHGISTVANQSHQMSGWVISFEDLQEKDRYLSNKDRDLNFRIRVIFCENAEPNELSVKKFHWNCSV